jgi:hypothetical protein
MCWVAILPGDIIAVDGSGVVVVPQLEAAEILTKAHNLLETEHIVQEKIKAGATIGELINVDEVFKTVFSYQNRAVEKSEVPGKQKPAASHKRAGQR